MPTTKHALVLTAALAAGLLAGCGGDKPEPGPTVADRKYDPPKANCPPFTGGPAATLGITGPAPKVDDPPSANGKNLMCTWDSAAYELIVIVAALPDKESSRSVWDVTTRDLIDPVTASGL